MDKKEIEKFKAKMFDDLNQRHIKLIKWLYDNYLSILREWESKQGNLRIEFLGKNEK